MGRTDPPTLDVLYVDNHVLAVNKPAGLPVAPDSSGDASLLDVAREWVRVEFSKPGNVFLGLAHRLDRPVSGIVVFGRTSKGAARLTEAFRARSAKKTYLGLVAETPELAWPGEWRELEQWLVKNRERNRSRGAWKEAPGAKQALTRWRVIAPARAGRAGESAQPCVLEFEPLTGRSHQLRLAALDVSGPLLGDLRYGAREPLADRSIGLHALRLSVPHPTRDEELELLAPLPDLAVWDAARGFAD